MSGTNAGIGMVGAAAVTVDPDPCNALTEGPSGLLVPSTTVEGLAPGTAVGTGRSVDVDVAAPAAGACPQEWQVGARLTPPYDEKLLQAFVDLVATPSGGWVDSTLSVDLPEAGVYEVSATLHTVIAVNPSSGAFNISISGRLWNAEAGTAVIGSQYTVQQWAANAAPTNFESDADLCTFHKFMAVTVPTTVRLEVMRLNSSGTPVSTTGLQVSNTRLAFKKISD
ncbi:hypothetical protein [Streptosporangium sp. CA-115845]|uniref:hypothetical protein n=1 Tax=Streptosporangium sp. CA-115845 TaxID=3240071 RepID=UPI003D93173C